LSGMTTQRRCQGTRKDGAPCESFALSDSQYCLNHDDRAEIRELQRAAWKAGGETSPYRQVDVDIPELGDGPKSIARVLEYLAEAVLKGELPPSLANSAGYLLSLATRAHGTAHQIEKPESTGGRLLWPWETDGKNSIGTGDGERDGD